MLPELLPLGAGALLVVRVALARARPVVGLEVGPAVAPHEPVLARGHDLAVRALTPRVQLHAGTLARVVDKVLEAGALRGLGGGVVGKVLAHRARPGRFLLVALPGGVVVVDLPLGLAVAPGAAGVDVQVEQFAWKKEEGMEKCFVELI